MCNVTVKMLKRKEEIGKRQFYRRVAYNVQTVLNEMFVCEDEKQNQNVSNIKELISWIFIIIKI